jgi:hypothetical protein
MLCELKSILKNPFSPSCPRALNMCGPALSTPLAGGAPCPQDVLLDSRFGVTLHSSSLFFTHSGRFLASEEGDKSSPLSNLAGAAGSFEKVRVGHKRQTLVAMASSSTAAVESAASGRWRRGCERGWRSCPPTSRPRCSGPCRVARSAGWCARSRRKYRQTAVRAVGAAQARLHGPAILGASAGSLLLMYSSPLVTDLHGDYQFL